MTFTYGIVLCSYKYGHLASHCIETVLAQTKSFDKIWVVDDGVGDCQHLIPLYAGRVEFVIRKDNLGIVDNFNDMLARVDTDFVMFLGLDNWLRTDALQLITKSIQNNHNFIPDICVYDIVVTGELKDELHRFYSHAMKPHQGDWYWSRKGGHHGSMLYNVQKAKDLGGYAHNNTSSRTDEDLNLWDKFQKAGCKSIHLNEGLLYYRRHNENFNKY